MAKSTHKDGGTNGSRLRRATALERESGPADHQVQFYEETSFLLDAVAPFVGTALKEKQGGIVIATRANLDALQQRWIEEGLDLARAHTEDRYFPLEAGRMLAEFMVDGMPDEKRFQRTIRPIIERAARGGRSVRAFGEMVALLCLDGNRAAALRLEQLWNQMIKAHRFSLLCGYPLRAFRGTQHQEGFRHICQEHSRVGPAETYTREFGVDGRLRAITELQQKADSLGLEVADRERAESALAAQQTKLSVAATLAQLGVWELDMATHELTGSELFKLALGVGPNEPLTFQRFRDLVHPDDATEVNATLQTAIDTAADFNTEFRIIDPAGNTRWIAMMGRGFHNGPHRLLGATLDITERKRASELLERTVQERTAELRETIGEIEAFSYSISHDMRAPLRSIQGFANILLDDCTNLEPENRNYLERIAASAQRMDRLIQDVLTFSRVARTELKFEPVNLDHLVRGIVECYPPLQAPQAKVSIDGVLPQVRGNAAALTQCLSNLLGNAVKFVAPGTTPEVRIWAERCERGIRLNIRDNGLGIAEEHQDRVFGIFQRLNKQYDGTGIGLAIVKKAAERMGGKVGLSSKLNEGSTFWLEVPAA